MEGKKKIDIDDFVIHYKKLFNIGADRRYSKRELSRLKAFTLACKMFGYSVNRTAQAINKHHTTLLHHLKHINSIDVFLADMLVTSYIGHLEWRKQNEQHG